MHARKHEDDFWIERLKGTCVKAEKQDRLTHTRTRLEREMATHLKRREILGKLGRLPAKSVRRTELEIDYY